MVNTRLASLVAEQLQRADRRLGQRVHRAQQRDLVVQRLAGPRRERRRDAQQRAVGVLEDERGAGRVPGGVAAGLEGGADAAGGERRRVGLALDELLAGELGQRRALAGRGVEAVVLLGGQAGQRLEHVACSGWRPSPAPTPSWPARRRRRAMVSSASPRARVLRQPLVDVLGQALALDGRAEDVGAEDLVVGGGEVRGSERRARWGSTGRRGRSAGGSRHSLVVPSWSAVGGRRRASMDGLVQTRAPSVGDASGSGHYPNGQTALRESAGRRSKAAISGLGPAARRPSPPWSTRAACPLDCRARARRRSTRRTRAATRRMAYRRCGRSGLEAAADLARPVAELRRLPALEIAAAILRRAFDLGITHFDLANNYGPPYGMAENNFGRMLAADFRPLATSWSSPPRPATTCGPGPTATGARASTCWPAWTRACKRMGLDYVDIFYSHRTDPETPLEETMGALDTAVRQGKALYAGISSYSPRRTAEATGSSAARHAAAHPPAVLLDVQPLDRARAARRARTRGRRRHRLLAAGPGPAHRQVSRWRAGGLARRRGLHPAQLLTPENLERVRALNAIAPGGAKAWRNSRSPGSCAIRA